MILKYTLLSLFIFITYFLSYKGMKKTNDITSFAIGKKDMNPYLIGLTMAASISSTATFVINPGFVYTHGLSALLHYGITATLGILAAFLLMTKKFRKFGDKTGALTIPDWIFHRYQSRNLSLFFAFINLLSITFIVLILIGCSFLMMNLFDISQTTGLTIILIFVFSYVLMGGTYSHAYTNAFQGFLMLFIAIFLFSHGLKHFDQGFFKTLEGFGHGYASVINPSSNLYYSYFSVFVSGFIVTFALMLQPHILTKVLYIKDDRDVKKFITTTIIGVLCFSLMLFIGFYARIVGIDGVAQDKIVKEYILTEFGAHYSVVITLTLLAAGLSTLDGILVAISTMVVKDIYMPFKNSDQSALKLSRLTLIAIGLISYVIALYPPRYIGLFAQKGVYGLASASFVPLLFGTLYKGSIRVSTIFISSIIGLITHLYLNIWGGYDNPAVSATYAIFLSSITFLILRLIQKSTKTSYNKRSKEARA